MNGSGGKIHHRTHGYEPRQHGGKLVSGGHVREKMENAIIKHVAYAKENGIDKLEITYGKWP
jgi:hypothetical protein